MWKLRFPTESTPRTMYVRETTRETRLKFFKTVEKNSTNTRHCAIQCSPASTSESTDENSNSIEWRIIQIEQHMDGHFHAHISGPRSLLLLFFCFLSLFLRRVACSGSTVFARAFSFLLFFLRSSRSFSLSRSFHYCYCRYFGWQLPVTMVFSV